MRKASPFLLGFLAVANALSITTIIYSIIESRRYSSDPLLPTPQIITQILKPTPVPVPFTSPPPTKIIPLRTHAFQSFNNCGPASLSMLFSYFDMNISQTVLGQKLRPYQVASGDNDDKNVFVSELAIEATERGFSSYHRPNGSIELLKKLIANDFPVLTRTWLDEKEDIGHYRVVRGYDDTKQILIQDDSLQGKNLSYSYDVFERLWEPYHFEFLVIAPKDKAPLIEAILGELVDEKTAWERVHARARVDLERDPSSVPANWTLSISAYHLGNYQETVSYFEKIQSQLPKRTLWYQIEPLEAYLKLKQYDKLFTITQQVFDGQNRAFAELYVLRGKAYLEQGKKSEAREEFEKAILYNKNLKSAQEALAAL